MTTRPYRSDARAKGAEESRRRILAAARELFGERGIDKVTIAEIGRHADVAGSTIYAIYKSKEGIIRALMEHSLFGSRFREAQAVLENVTDPFRLIELTASVARAIYQSESEYLGLVRNVSGFSPSLRNIEREFEELRFDMQQVRLKRLYDVGGAREGLKIEEAQRIMWMLTSREPFRMLVEDGGWDLDRFEAWLAQTLLEAICDQGKVQAWRTKS